MSKHAIAKTGWRRKVELEIHARDMSIEALAKATGLAMRTLYRCLREGKQTKGTDELIAKLADYFGWSIGWMMDDKEEWRESPEPTSQSVTGAGELEPILSAWIRCPDKRPLLVAYARALCQSGEPTPRGSTPRGPSRKT